MIRRTVLIACSMALLSLTSPAMASPSNLRAHLTGDEEVPARETRAQGQAVFQIVSPTLVRYRLLASNISNVVAAHVHCADTSAVQLLFGPATPGGGRHDGVLAEGTFDPATKSCGGDSLLNAMTSGTTYVNVHTNDGVAPTNTGPGDFPGGEIRGQIQG